jgi:hypothetical protein
MAGDVEEIRLMQGLVPGEITVFESSDRYKTYLNWGRIVICSKGRPRPSQNYYLPVPIKEKFVAHFIFEAPFAFRRCDVENAAGLFDFYDDDDDILPLLVHKARFPHLLEPYRSYPEDDRIFVTFDDLMLLRMAS